MKLTTLAAVPSSLALALALALVTGCDRPRDTTPATTTTTGTDYTHDASMAPSTSDTTSPGDYPKTPTDTPNTYRNGASPGDLGTSSGAPAAKPDGGAVIPPGRTGTLTPQTAPQTPHTSRRGAKDSPGTPSGAGNATGAVGGP